ncbi:hypothetical protein KM043_003606 [Ampulex compressa]|nr:hypothetical protein KM043_003606 [Ampulex compressa]
MRLFPLARRGIPKGPARPLEFEVLTMIVDDALGEGGGFLRPYKRPGGGEARDADTHRGSSRGSEKEREGEGEGKGVWRRNLREESKEEAGGVDGAKEERTRSEEASVLTKVPSSKG